MTTTTKSRPTVENHEAGKSLAGDLPRVTHIHPDAQHRRPEIQAGGHSFAAKFAQLERVALELVEDLDVERYRRASRIYSEWAQRYAELNDPAQARECHGISESLKCRAELIRRYPGEFTEILAVLADVFAEKRGA
ncbi:MAG: hypothetical protein ACTHU1_13540 [Arachnia sp.]